MEFDLPTATIRVLEDDTVSNSVTPSAMRHNKGVLSASANPFVASERKQNRSRSVVKFRLDKQEESVAVMILKILAQQTNLIKYVEVKSKLFEWILSHFFPFPQTKEVRGWAGDVKSRAFFYLKWNVVFFCLHKF